MFFENDNDLETFIDTWVNCWDNNKEDVEMNVCSILGIDMKEAIRRAKTINNQGIRLPGYDRKRMKKLSKV